MRSKLGAETMPVSAVAKRLGVSRQRVYQMVEENKLIAQKIDCTVMVYSSSVEWAEAMRMGGVKSAA